MVGWIWLNTWGFDMSMDTGTFLVDMLSNFPFLGFIIWQYLTAQKDLKEQREKMENIRKEQMDQKSSSIHRHIKPPSIQPYPAHHSLSSYWRHENGGQILSTFLWWLVHRDYLSSGHL